eukprot:CAMPEP_0205928024 /NCGR_PEP_ID=MMETSP1325-20131115/23909_1 /ASSEMBLY_ACC=CAM_ASM_000708 /TAXON_ID=236786 /ORGANISM="Florenciella sp., Strain RCC1007" /LENGTH=84 /DNA_ID=CAMNT_0053296995 /DNA_START=59 /DNA_END=310 /DNA_ORIENTATION=-
MTGVVAQSDSWRLHAVIHGLLMAGAATDVGFTLTFSHTLALADMNRTLLRDLVDASDDGQVVVLDVIASVWASSPRHVSLFCVE